MNKTVAIVFLLLCNVAQAQDISRIFPDLKQYVFRGTGISIWYNPQLTTLLDTKSKNTPREDYAEDKVRPMVTKLTGEKEKSFVVECDPGPSFDPSCTIYEMVGGVENRIFSHPGDTFVFPGNGIVYVLAFNDVMFEKRMKFQYQNGTFEEVSQPFYFVGLDSRLNKDIILYSAPGGAGEVAKLSKGSSVTVLLNKEDNYLLKTPFGLVGWAQVPYGEPHGSPENIIDGLYFHGD